MHVALFFTQAHLRRSPSRRIPRSTSHSISPATPPRQTFAPPPGNHRFFTPFFSSTSETLFSQPLCFHIYRNPPIVFPSALFHSGSFFPHESPITSHNSRVFFSVRAISTKTPNQPEQEEIASALPLSTFNLRLSTSFVVNPLPPASNSTRRCCKEE